MRNLAAVIDRMLAVVDEMEPGHYYPSDRFRMKDELVAIKSRLMLTPPEVMPQRWVECCEVITEAFFNPYYLNGWQKAVADVWMDRATVEARP